MRLDDDELLTLLYPCLCSPPGALIWVIFPEKNYFWEISGSLQVLLPESLTDQRNILFSRVFCSPSAHMFLGLQDFGEVVTATGSCSMESCVASPFSYAVAHSSSPARLFGDGEVGPCGRSLKCTRCIV